MNKPEEQAGVIKLMSFGFKYGLPNANCYFDVSFAKNPAREQKWGLFATEDEDMVRYVLGQAKVSTFISLAVPMVEHIATVDAYHVIAFGCNSGRHRSPIIVNAIADGLRGKVRCLVEHRDRPDFEKTLQSIRE
jgi:UPF0042 nucleotide-binding protein